MSSAFEIEPSGFDAPGAGKRGAHVRAQATAIADAAASMRRRPAEPKSFRGRAEIASARKDKKRKDRQDAAKQASDEQAEVKRNGPTRERIEKGDLVRTTGGQLVAESGLDRLRRTFRREDVAKTQDLLARLHHRASLSDDPGMSERMYQAGKRYEELVHVAGLSGIAAQNLLSAGGGGADPAYMMPASEAARAARAKLRAAWDLLPDESMQALHALLVDGVEVAAIGRRFSNYAGLPQQQAAGIVLLRIALSMLVARRWA